MAILSHSDQRHHYSCLSSRRQDTVIGAGTTVFELTGQDGNTAADLIADLGTTATNADLDIGDRLVIISYQAGNAGAQLWSFTDTNGQNIDQAELALIATLANVNNDAFDANNIGS